ncbi:beta-phosphoglucomutase-like phosphatase (HAD superfamily) [Kitasatospora sp. MAA4]|uniref:HAD family hydrolase n=1 Tax=Kitasatospora sp. MAA4 TaxID=3035093 RepID=UPI002476123B|nr:HAD family phosphatase [Kitasatospora sp. MAA4]MDH6133823.1 beta-phosphoglucomutase-like phosphatase (HAD superfamily) [Kitasatospora sp. MAA4]
MSTELRHSSHTGQPCPGSCVPAIPKGVEALILDFDGTLADTTAGHEDALRTALLPYGIDLDHDWYRQHVGLSIRDLLAALSGGLPLPYDEIIAKSRAHLLATVHTIKPIACVVALLSLARHAGLPCAVASGASRLLVEPGLDVLGLTHEFAAVVAREDATNGKPDPELFLTAARRLGVSAGNCLAVDDAPDGIASAREAGMRVLTVIGGHLAPVGSAERAAPASSPAGGRDAAAPPATASPRSADPAR